MLPRILSSIGIGEFAWWYTEPRTAVCRIQKTSLKEFKVTNIYEKKMLIKYQIERVK